MVEVAVVERGELSPATVGSSVEDAKTILAGVQDTVVAEHCRAALDAVSCRVVSCRVWPPVRPQGRPTARGAHPLRQDDGGEPTLVDVAVSGARRVFTPLAWLLPDRSTPELVLVEAKLAAQVPYRD